MAREISKRKNDMGEISQLPIDEQPIARFHTTVDGPTHHYQGWIRVAVYASGTYLQWEGETDWHRVTWWEMAHFAHVTPPKLRDELDWIREEAYTKGLAEAVQDAKKHPELWLDKEKPPATR